MKIQISHRPVHTERGSALVTAMGTLGVLIYICAYTFLIAWSRYRSTSQTASWQESLFAAESGVDMSVSLLRNTLSAPTGFPSGVNGSLQQFLDYQNFPTVDGTENGMIALSIGSTTYKMNGTVITGTNRVYDGTGRVIITGTSTANYRRIQLPTFSINKTGDGGSRLSSTAVIEPIYMSNNSSGGMWYRIQSTGSVPLSSGQASTTGIQKYDNLLRKLDYFIDHRTQTPVSAPQASRSIEVIAKPVTIGSAAMLASNSISFTDHNVTIDSYDSRYPGETSDASGKYSQSLHTSNATIANNDTGASPGTDLKGATVAGSVFTNTDTPTGTGNVTGSVSNGFYQTLPPPPDPSVLWANSNYTVNTNGSINASGSNTSSLSPARYKETGDLSSLTIAAPPAGTTGYVEIWVAGGLSMTGNSEIDIPANVRVTLYIEGSLSAKGNGIVNASTNPANLIVYGNSDPTKSQSITIAGNGVFAGVIYAPYASVSAKGGGSKGDIYGSIVAHDISFTGGSSLHYDSALGTNAPAINYSIASWYEDNTLTRSY